MKHQHYNTGININFICKEIDKNYEDDRTIFKIQQNGGYQGDKNNITCCGVTSSCHV